jgi:antitoxin HicB
MVRYPVTLAPDDNDTILVTFPDFPEAHTFGDDESEAIARADDALETVIDAYIRDKRDIPAPSRVTGASVTLPSLVAAKVQIYNQMRQQRVGKAELARRLGAHLPQVDRLLDLKHGSKLDQLEAAAHALGAYLDVSVVSCAPMQQARQPAAMATRRSVTTATAGRRPGRRPARRAHPGVLAVHKTKSARRSVAAATKKK